MLESCWCCFRSPSLVLAPSQAMVMPLMGFKSLALVLTLLRATLDSLVPVSTLIGLCALWPSQCFEPGPPGRAQRSHMPFRH